MFGKRSGQSTSRRDQTSILYSFDDFHLYVDFLARQHNAHFKIASMTDMMKIVNGIEADIPEVLYLENHRFENSAQDAVKPRHPTHDNDIDNLENYDLIDEEESELEISFEQEEPFVLIKKSKSLPTLVMPTKLIQELKEYTLFKKTEKQVTPKSESIDTDFEVLDNDPPVPPTD